MSEKVKAYVVKYDKIPMVAITTDQHRRLNQETLRKAILNSMVFAEQLRKTWDESDWFPCGGAWLHVPGNSEIVLFIKKHGTTNGSRYEFGEMRISKDYPKGYSINLSLSSLSNYDAISCQSMKYNIQVCAELQKQLAFLNVRTELKSYID